MNKITKRKLKSFKRINKSCNHKFRHITILSRSMVKTNMEKYEWVVHECVKCHKRSDGAKLE